MQPLLRPEFRPKLWSPADLDATAAHWLWLFDQAPATAGRSADHRTEVRLRGFPSAEREAVAAALAARLPDFEVTRPDAETLIAIGSALDFEMSPAAGLGVPTLSGPPLDGLYLEVRLTATARKPNGKPHAAGTLVLAGELGPDGFTVYAVWGEGANALANQQAREVPWADEQAWRADLENFRANRPVGATAATLAKKLFARPPGWFVRAGVWLAAFPFTGERRPRRFLAKLTANVGLIAATTVTIFSFPTSDDLGVVLNVLIVALLALPLALLLYQLALGLILVRRITTAIYAALYSHPFTLVPADTEVSASYFGNPSAREAAADWGAIGARSLGDGVHENPELRRSAFRLLATAEGTVNVLLLAVERVPNPDGTIRQHFWPPPVLVKVVTRFPDDGTVMTTNDAGTVFRRNLFGPESVGRVLPGLTDPAELLARHADSCRRYAERTGRAPLSSLGFAEFTRSDAERSEQERRLYARNPVTWSDAFVFLMGYVRRAYR